MSRSYFASFPVCVYKFSCHYLNNKFYRQYFGALTRESPYTIFEQNTSGMNHLKTEELSRCHITNICFSRHSLKNANLAKFPCSIRECTARRGGIPPLIFNLGIVWSVVVSFKPRRLQSELKSAQYTLKSLPAGDQRRPGLFGTRKKSIAPAGNRTAIPLSSSSLCSHYPE